MTRNTKEVALIQIRSGKLSEMPKALHQSEFGLAKDANRVFLGNPSNTILKNRTEFPYQNLELLTEFSELKDYFKYSYENNITSASGVADRLLLKEFLPIVISCNGKNPVTDESHNGSLIINKQVTEAIPPGTDINGIVRYINMISQSSGVYATVFPGTEVITFISIKNELSISDNGNHMLDLLDVPSDDYDISMPIRKVTEKLDDNLNITDFGIKGDGVTGVSKKIYESLIEIYKNFRDSQFYRNVFFPAGTYVYNISNEDQNAKYFAPFPLISNLHVHGEGIDRTIISNTTSNVLLSCIDDQFNAEYADSEAYGSVDGAKNIVIEDMTFKSETSKEIMRLIGCNNVTFNRVKFVGSQDSLIASIYGKYRFITERDDLYAQNIIFNECIFDTAACAIDIEEYAKNVTFNNCTFTNIGLSTPTPELKLDTSVKIGNNAENQKFETLDYHVDEIEYGLRLNFENMSIPAEIESEITNLRNEIKDFKQADPEDYDTIIENCEGTLDEIKSKYEEIKGTSIPQEISDVMDELIENMEDISDGIESPIIENVKAINFNGCSFENTVIQGENNAVITLGTNAKYVSITKCTFDKDIIERTDLSGTIPYLDKGVGEVFNSTLNYVKGDRCLYDHKYYIANTDISAGAEFNPEQWDEHQRYNYTDILDINTDERKLLRFKFAQPLWEYINYLTNPNGEVVLTVDGKDSEITAANGLNITENSNGIDIKSVKDGDVTISLENEATLELGKQTSDIEWKPSTDDEPNTYYVGDEVLSDGIIYRCINEHVAAKTSFENDQLTNDVQNWEVKTITQIVIDRVLQLNDHMISNRDGSKNIIIEPATDKVVEIKQTEDSTIRYETNIVNDNDAVPNVAFVKQYGISSIVKHITKKDLENMTSSTLEIADFPKNIYGNNIHVTGVTVNVRNPFYKVVPYLNESSVDYETGYTYYQGDVVKGASGGTAYAVITDTHVAPEQAVIANSDVMEVIPNGKYDFDIKYIEVGCVDSNNSLHIMTNTYTKNYDYNNESTIEKIDIQKNNRFGYESAEPFSTSKHYDKDIVSFQDRNYLVDASTNLSFLKLHSNNSDYRREYDEGYIYKFDEDSNFNLGNPSIKNPYSMNYAGGKVVMQFYIENGKSLIESYVVNNQIVLANLTELENYDKTTLNNDAIIEVTSDSEHNDQHTYYRYDEKTNSYDYIGNENCVTLETSGESPDIIYNYHVNYLSNSLLNPAGDMIIKVDFVKEEV